MANHIRYYLIGSGNATNLARVVNHDYAYLDHETGDWVRHPHVFDMVEFEASTEDLTLAQAKVRVKKIAPNVEPEWLDGVET